MAECLRWWRVMRWSIFLKAEPMTLCSSIVLGIIMSISDICFPETSVNVDPAPTVSAYSFSSPDREKIKYESSFSAHGTIDWKPWFVQALFFKIPVLPIPAREVKEPSQVEEFEPNSCHNPLLKSFWSWNRGIFGHWFPQEHTNRYLHPNMQDCLYSEFLQPRFLIHRRAYAVPNL